MRFVKTVLITVFIAAAAILTGDPSVRAVRAPGEAETIIGRIPRLCIGAAHNDKAHEAQAGKSMTVLGQISSWLHAASSLFALNSTSFLTLMDAVKEKEGGEEILVIPPFKLDNYP